MSDRKQWVKVVSAETILPNEPYYHDLDYETVAIFRLGDTFYAIEDRCTHDDGPLAEGKIDHATCQIICPRHGARFDLRNGDALSLPAWRPVPCYDVKVEDGILYISIPTE